MERYLYATDNFRITFDKHNFIVQKYITRKNRQDKSEYQVWGDDKFFPTIQLAFNYILQQEIKDQDANIVKELIHKIKEIENKILHAISTKSWTLKELNDAKGE